MANFVGKHKVIVSIGRGLLPVRHQAPAHTQHGRICARQQHLHFHHTGDTAVRHQAIWIYVLSYDMHISHIQSFQFHLHGQFHGYTYGHQRYKQRPGASQAPSPCPFITWTDLCKTAQQLHCQHTGDTASCIKPFGYISFPMAVTHTVISIPHTRSRFGYT